jgi:hypothetical protein
MFLRYVFENLQFLDLKVENAKLRADNMELQCRIDKLNKELQESKELNEMLIKINEEFRKENDTLYEQIDFYKNLRMPRSMNKSSKPKRKHQRYHKILLSVFRFIIIRIINYLLFCQR